MTEKTKIKLFNITLSPCLMDKSQVIDFSEISQVYHRLFSRVSLSGNISGFINKLKATSISPWIISYYYNSRFCPVLYEDSYIKFANSENFISINGYKNYFLEQLFSKNVKNNRLDFDVVQIISLFNGTKICLSLSNDLYKTVMVNNQDYLQGDSYLLDLSNDGVEKSIHISPNSGINNYILTNLHDKQLRIFVADDILFTNGKNCPKQNMGVGALYSPKYTSNGIKYFYFSHKNSSTKTENFITVCPTTNNIPFLVNPSNDSRIIIDSTVSAFILSIPSELALAVERDSPIVIDYFYESQKIKEIKFNVTKDCSTVLFIRMTGSTIAIFNNYSSFNECQNEKIFTS